MRYMHMFILVYDICIVLMHVYLYNTYTLMYVLEPEYEQALCASADAGENSARRAREESCAVAGSCNALMRHARARERERTSAQRERERERERE